MNSYFLRDDNGKRIPNPQLKGHLCEFHEIYKYLTKFMDEMNFKEKKHYGFYKLCEDYYITFFSDLNGGNGDKDGFFILFGEILDINALTINEEDRIYYLDVKKFKKDNVDVYGLCSIVLSAIRDYWQNRKEIKKYKVRRFLNTCKDGSVLWSERK